MGRYSCSKINSPRKVTAVSNPNILLRRSKLYKESSGENSFCYFRKTFFVLSIYYIITYWIYFLGYFLSLPEKVGKSLTDFCQSQKIANADLFSNFLLAPAHCWKKRQFLNFLTVFTFLLSLLDGIKNAKRKGKERTGEEASQQNQNLTISVVSYCPFQFHNTIDEKTSQNIFLPLV